VSFMPWFMAGLYDPRLVVPEEVASRWQVILRYAVAMPSVAMLLLMTSFWGGFGASLGGWLVGLAAVPIELFVEKRWRRWRAARAGRDRAAARERQRSELARARGERDLLTLDPDLAPTGADTVVMQLWEVKRELVGLRRPDLAVQADRLFTRYHRALDVLDDKFDAREVTYERARGLVGEVGREATAGLGAMVELVHGSAGLDADFVRERLEREAARLNPTEREALRAGWRSPTRPSAAWRDRRRQRGRADRARRRRGRRRPHRHRPQPGRRRRQHGAGAAGTAPLRRTRRPVRAQALNRGVLQ
jgi:hypothetical protein